MQRTFHYKHDKKVKEFRSKAGIEFKEEATALVKEPTPEKKSSAKTIRYERDV
jgi:hypothetical protein